MSKYTSNEQYEKDKADWLLRLKLHLNKGCDLDALDVLELFNLLNQSKWIGADKEVDNNNWVTFTSRLDAENYANKLIAEGAKDVAIRVLTNRIHSKRGVVYTVTFNVCKDFISK